MAYVIPSVFFDHGRRSAMPKSDAVQGRLHHNLSPLSFWLHVGLLLGLGRIKAYRLMPVSLIGSIGQGKHMTTSD
ncbi:MAG: hypothetical protein ABJ327_26240 [Litoreibacter sp.]